MQLHGGVSAAQDRLDVLLDVVGLAFLNEQHSALALAELDHLVIDYRVGDIHDVERDLALAVDIGKFQQFECAVHVIEQATLQDDADVLAVTGQVLIELVLLDVLHGCGPALGELLLLMREVHRGQHDAAEIALRILDCLLDRHLRRLVVLGDE